MERNRRRCLAQYLASVDRTNWAGSRATARVHGAGRVARARCRLDGSRDEAIDLDVEKCAHRRAVWRRNVAARPRISHRDRRQCATTATARGFCARGVGGAGRRRSRCRASSPTSPFSASLPQSNTGNSRDHHVRQQSVDALPTTTSLSAARVAVSEWGESCQVRGPRSGRRELVQNGWRVPRSGALTEYPSLRSVSANAS